MQKKIQYRLMFWGSIMNINCPNCSFNYEIDDNKIPDEGANVKCSECGEIFEVLSPKESILYVKLSEDSIYPASLTEIKEWIIERRVLDTHEVSKDKTFWMPLSKHPDLKSFFPKKGLDPLADEPTTNFKEEEPKKELDESVKEQIKKELQEELQMKSRNNFQPSSLNYSDYDDSTIDDINEFSSGGKSKIFSIIFLLIIVGAGIFALVKPNLVKGVFNKVTNKKEKKITYYEDAMVEFNKASFPAEYLRVKPLLNKALEDKKSYTKALSTKSLMYTLSMFYYDTNLKSDEDIKMKIVNLKDNPEKKETYLKLKSMVKNLKNSIEKNKKEYKNSKKLFKKDLEEIEKFSAENAHAAVSMAIWSYLNKDTDSLFKYIGKVETLKSDSKYLEFIKILKEELENPEKLLANLKFKTSKSPLVNYLIAQKFMKNSNFDLALTSFKTVVATTTRHDPSALYIDRLKTLLEYKTDLGVIKKEDSEEKDGKISKDGKKDTKIKKDKTKKDEKIKKDEKVAKKVVKKLSPKQESKRGWALLDAGKNSAAIKRFKKAIDGDSNLADAYYGLAEAYLAIGNKKKALFNYKECLSIDPSHEEAALIKKQIKKLQ